MVLILKLRLQEINIHYWNCNQDCHKPTKSDSGFLLTWWIMSSWLELPLRGDIRCCWLPISDLISVDSVMLTELEQSEPPPPSPREGFSLRPLRLGTGVEVTTIPDEAWEDTSRSSIELSKEQLPRSSSLQLIFTISFALFVFTTSSSTIVEGSYKSCLKQKQCLR